MILQIFIALFSRSKKAAGVKLAPAACTDCIIKPPEGSFDFYTAYFM